MKIDIVDIAYNDLSTLKLYKGRNLIWERVEEPPMEYPEYDMVLNWNSRTYSTAGIQSSNGAWNTADYAKRAASLCFRQGTRTRYNLTPYLEDEPSNITKCCYSDLLNNDLTSLANAFKGWQYLYGGTYTDTENGYLTEVKLLRIPSTCTSLASTFNSCYVLTTANIAGDTSNVTSFNGMFSGCSNLTTVWLNNIKIQNSADVNNMFSRCENLKKIYMVGCDEETIKKVESVMPKEATIIK